jgi:hypothetical protein
MKHMAKWIRQIVSAALVAALALAGLLASGPAAVYAQRKTPAKRAAPVSAYNQGYLKGYNSGYTQGQSDWNRGVPRDLFSSDAYNRREQNYDASLASSEEYRQAFNLGLEFGYIDGYFGRPRSTSVPSNGAVIAKATALANAQREREQIDDQASRADRTQPSEPVRDDPQQQTRDRVVTRPGTLDIAPNTLLNLRLETTIDTKNNRAGDRFRAVVTAPPEYEGATVEGHIGNINKSGKVSGRTELALAFDHISMPDGRQAPLAASLEKVVESESVKKIDEEGNVQSGSRTTDSKIRGGAGAAAGAIIGGIIGGGKGAVLGAILGGAAGVGTVYVEGGKDLILEPGTEMIIRTERTRAR